MRQYKKKLIKTSQNYQINNLSLDFTNFYIIICKQFANQLSNYYKFLIMIKDIQYKSNNWTFKFKEGGLSPSAIIQQIQQKCKLFRPPTMIFANNQCLIKNQTSNFSIKYNAQQALKYINHQHRKNTYSSLQSEPKVDAISYIPQRMFIKHAQKWKTLTSPKDIQICEIQQSSDCFFITPFKGLIQGDAKIERVKQSVIPVHKLGPQNPIQFYFQGNMYEDELDDNGLVVYDYKFRSMKNSWFGLIRMYARIDDVAILIIDTRIYWQQGSNKVARQFMVKKNSWSQLKDKNFEFKNGWTMDPNQSHHIYSFLDEKFVQNQYIHFK